MLKYKGYTARIKYDREDRVYHGTVENIADTIHFEGDTPEGATQAFRDSVDDYLEWAKEDGFKAEKPRSSSITVRLDSDLHRRAATAAKRANLSLNAFIVNCLGKAVSGARGPHRRATSRQPRLP